MKQILIFSAVLLIVSCKKHTKTLEQVEREKALEQLIEEEEFDDLPDEDQDDE
jgi:heme exporter protein D